jgi:hypothetical protein
MEATQLLGLALLLLLFGFIGFAFRQGMRIKPERGYDANSPIYPDDLTPPR